MNYPIWETLRIGGPTLIALIAVLHVFVAHLAVGGGLFLWLTDIKGYREQNPAIHGYLKRYLRFFLLLTMVFGAVTGVGIWFIIALVSPAATAILIRNFVFGWATEWVFFLGEIVALLIYYYHFDTLSRKFRLRISFFYFLFAWLSLFVITGIIDFMLTPGSWLQTRDFWDGFFNPSFWPSLFFRSFMAFTLAGLFGCLTTIFLEDRHLRQTLLRYCTKWLLFPLVGLVPAALWYMRNLPLDTRAAVAMNRAMPAFLDTLLVMTLVIFVLGIVLSVMKARSLQKAAAFLLVPVGIFWIGSFEYSRENARRPFLIVDYLYSNAIPVSQVEKLDREGILTHARWTAVRKISPENRLLAGHEIFRLECLSCHTVRGIRNDIVPLVENYTYRGLIAQITGQGKLLPYMPPFVGTKVEKEALAAYITTDILGRKAEEKPFEPVGWEPGHDMVPVKIPPFDPQKDEYVLLAWNDLGMHCTSDCDEAFSFLPPANTLEAQLVKRGDPPEILTQGIEITYQVEAGHRNPASQVPFWEFSKSVYGTRLEKNTGLAGMGLGGVFKLLEGQTVFQAKWIPVVPYRDNGKAFNPYPTFTVQALRKDTGEILQTTRVTAPVSTETDCYRCHGGGPRKLGSGISENTAKNILAIHDRIQGTTLLKDALAGRPRLCQSCHGDPALGAKGDDGVLNLSAAIHGRHAGYMSGMGNEACMYCHPISYSGVTRCLRGVHGGGEKRTVCSDCHGTLDDMAGSLLKGEADKPRAKFLMGPLPQKSLEAVKARVPWLQEPECLACHKNFEKPASNPSAVNHWNTVPGELFRMKSDEAGAMRCIACHGSTHAIYPAKNPFDTWRDAIAPMQYQKNPYAIGANRSCFVCHTEAVEDSVHHANMFREVRVKGEF